MAPPGEAGAGPFGPGPGRCVFCAIVSGEAPASVVLRDDACTAFLDVHPASRGHLLVVPNVHAARLAELPAGTQERLFGLGAALLAAVRAEGIAGEGANLLLNDGAAANQSVPHVHVHVVPRRRGDTLRVLATFAARAAGLAGRPARREELDALAGRLRDALGEGPAVRR